MKTHASLIQFCIIYLGGFIIRFTEFRGVKRCAIKTKQYKLVYIELVGCLLYGSCPYQNITDQRTSILVYL